MTVNPFENLFSFDFCIQLIQGGPIFRKNTEIPSFAVKTVLYFIKKSILKKAKFNIDTLNGV